jgi:hypothetical protein
VAKITFAGRTINLPQNKALRIGLGVALVLAGGLGGWLPILGFWMLPLGLVILSVDIPWVRRRRRRFYVWIVNWWRRSDWLRPVVNRVIDWWYGPDGPDGPTEPPNAQTPPNERLHERVPVT